MPKCLTDLTEREWEWVHPALPPDGTPPDAARRTVNLLRYRECAELPWPLLDRTDEDVVRARNWAVAGHWEALQRRLASLPPQREPIPQTIRRRLARAIRRVPGGAMALAPTRP